MKPQTKLLLGLLVLLFAGERGSCSPAENFTENVSYAAPTNFYMFDYSDGNYPTPFIIGGSAVEYDSYLNDPNSHVQFELGMACYSFGKDGAKLLPARPSDLKRDFDAYYRGIFTNMPTARIGKLDGFTTVSASIVTKPPNFEPCYVFPCWVQIKTNVVVRITVSSCDLKTFSTLTNSLQSVKINKHGILKLVASQEQKGIALPFPRIGRADEKPN